MTIVYTIEITAQYDDTEERQKYSELGVLDPMYKKAWEHKVEKVMEQHIPDANVVCTDIKVFPKA